jgi:hypothetical protein
MADQPPTRIFISYSRVDSDFVDRLEADLRSRGFDTWVDRRRLEGGQDWASEIEHAIDRSDLMLVALSPEAEASPWVKLEYERALSDAKPLIPLIYRECHIPDGLASTQAESLIGLPYNQSILKTLDRLTRLLDPSLALPTDLGELYRRALATERSDPEQASRLLQRIVDRDAAYAGGESARDLARINEKLLPARVERLRREAQEAHQSGEYGREAGALEAWVALAPKDAWAQEYLPIAQTNRHYLDLYAAIQHLIEVGDTAEAQNKLTRLWQDAPYFRDPAGLAPRLGLPVPPTYEEAKERAAAEGDSGRQKLEADHAKQQTREVAMKGRGRRQDDATRTYEQELRAEDTRWAESSRNAAVAFNSGDPNTSLAGLPDAKIGAQIVPAFKEVQRLDSEAKQTNEALLRAKRRFDHLRAKPVRRVIRYLASGLAASGIMTVYLLLYLNSYVPIGKQDVFFGAHRDLFDAVNTLLGTVITRAGVATACLLFLAWPLLVLWTAIQIRSATRHSQEISDGTRRAQQALQQQRAQSLTVWLREQGELHDQKMAQIGAKREQSFSEAENTFNNTVVVGEDVYQRRLAEIEAEYQRELADIAQRYSPE